MPEPTDVPGARTVASMQPTRRGTYAWAMARTQVSADLAVRADRRRAARWRLALRHARHALAAAGRSIETAEELYLAAYGRERALTGRALWTNEAMILRTACAQVWRAEGARRAMTPVEVPA